MNELTMCINIYDKIIIIIMAKIMAVIGYFFVALLQKMC